MADAPPTSLDHLRALADRLHDPQPMCVVLITVEPGPAPDGLDPTAVEARLRGTLRDYDELVVLPGGGFAVLLPTLAEADGLRRRVDQIHDLLRAPYDGPGHRAEVSGSHRGPVCRLGAAIRRPGEEPDDFLRRVAGAHQAAGRNGDGGPVLV